jgi:hypothetical protein
MAVWIPLKMVKEAWKSTGKIQRGEPEAPKEMTELCSRQKIDVFRISF